MRLSDFIRANMEPILAEWSAFVRTHNSFSQETNETVLRDHALEMLDVIAADITGSQTRAEQLEKGKGRAALALKESPATKHGAQRALAGFTFAELISEYRALRASVLRLWVDATRDMSSTDRDDLMRFNEAIDQAITESTSRFASEVEHARQMFVAVLGHDLRTPLGAILIGSEYMLHYGNLAPEHVPTAQRIVRSATRMDHLVNTLLDFTRVEMGADIPIVRAEIRIDEELRFAVEEVQAAYPDSKIQIEQSGTLRCSLDPARMQQVWTNVLNNAVQHGEPGAQITVTVHGNEWEVMVGVHNSGAIIKPQDLPGLFNPMKRIHPGADSSWDSKNFGLGLYVAHRIVVAHAGTITITSGDDTGTLFNIHLPCIKATNGATVEHRMVTSAVAT